MVANLYSYYLYIRRVLEAWLYNLRRQQNKKGGYQEDIKQADQEDHQE